MTDAPRSDDISPGLQPRAARPSRRTRRRRALVVTAVVLAALVGAALWQREHPHVLRTEVEIDAPPALVWDVLTDFAAYPEWNPGLVGMTGELAVGETLTFAADDSADALTFVPVVLEVTPEETLCWEGRLLVPGLFDGEHVFELHPTDGGGTRLVQAEYFRGVAIPFTAWWLDRHTLPDFVGMNEALAERAESLAAEAG